jgi:hypothetical protein
MRKLACIVLLFIVGASVASAQHYVGIKGGYGAAQGRLYSSYGSSEGAMILGKYTGGLMWKYYSPQPVFGGIAVEMEFQQRGYRVFEGTVSDTTLYNANTRTVSSITLPLIWQPHFYLMNRKVRVWASAGVTLSYNLGIGDRYTVTQYNEPNKVDGQWDPQTSEIIEDSPYKMQTARDVRWNYGWLAGGGIGVLIGRWEVFAEGRYYYGMSDLLRTETKYQFNEDNMIRSELDNIYITMGVYFRLGKGGILEPPRSRRRAPSNTNDFRNIKLDM